MMTQDMIIRAWKDPSFRATLTAEQLAELPANPSGLTMNELNEGDLMDVVGGRIQAPVSHANSCGYICTLTTECGC
ncbi:mersacidin/lichenicidin family type 2 lantibiotic [Corallococcus aberystwythensis]|uniref:Mersacidin/lichenicidin family type 2 lantibiotic n=1 Tax=Corallococcus aberystwythensis TaxID=2316722 RepID=A0A3A8QIH9_9BACT|nr:mersacidin/lichenicidin family type 2 lantibiotic [Corallococcus aberystwythensis]RKH66125.1 mersacidin/lichenicidin family type 2 lantibiotic [Corallococcus aberystwythensis]